MTTTPSAGEIRQWALGLGLPISSGGRIPRGILERWDATHPDRPSSRKPSVYNRPDFGFGYDHEGSVSRGGKMTAESRRNRGAQRI